MAILQVGDVLTDMSQNTKYRVIALQSDSAVLCQMDIDNLSLLSQSISLLLDLISQDQISVEHPTFSIFNPKTLSESVAESFAIKKKAMKELSKAYGPTYLDLMGKKAKPEAKRIMEKYNIKKATFWNICRRYLQSGLQDISLVDQKAFGNTKDLELTYSTKTGRPSEYFENTGVVLTDEIRGYFEEALKDLKSGRQKTIRSAFDRMNNMHFTRVDIVDGVQAVNLLPVSERPTYKQLYNYISKHLSEKEKDLIKTSAREQRNNKRLLVSDSLYGVNGPGDMVEIDACEVDVSLVGIKNENQSVGRPVIYFMVDVYSRIILAASIAFDNNSALGLTNLFLNLADDKQKFCQQYGMSFDNPDMWPSNIIPKRVRIDHGAEFKGKQFERICETLDIERVFAPVATGSMKGIVEQSFHQLHQKQNVHLEKKGLIEKRYDSKHHTESTLNIDQYSRIVINFILTHNQEYMKGYRPTKDMLDKDVPAIPVALWKYGIEKYGAPRPIINRDQYMFDMMTPVKAKLSKRGICYKDLWYLPSFADDTKISREMFNAGTKKVPFEVRMDMRDVGAVFYERDGKLIKAPLNPLLHGNLDYDKMTMSQYEKYLHLKRTKDAEGRVHNEALSAFNHAVNHTVADEVKKIGPSNKKNLREAREQEKQLISSRNKIEKRLPEQIEAPEQPKALPETKPAPEVKQEPKKKFTSFKEALEDLWDE